MRGEGRYTDDLSLDGQLYAAFVRSPYAHGVIRGIDITDATAMKGVVAIYTAQDLEGQGYGALKCALTSPERYAGCAAFSAVTDLRAAMADASPGAARKRARVTIPPGGRLAWR